MRAGWPRWTIDSDAYANDMSKQRRYLRQVRLANATPRTVLCTDAGDDAALSAPSALMHDAENITLGAFSYEHIRRRQYKRLAVKKQQRSAQTG